MKLTKNQLEVAAYFVVHGSDEHGWLGNLAKKIKGHGEHGKLSSEEEDILRLAWGKRSEEDIEVVKKVFNAGQLKYDEIIDQIKPLTADEKYQIYFLVCRGMVSKRAKETPKEADGWLAAYKFRDEIGIDSAGYTNWIRK